MGSDNDDVSNLLDQLFVSGDGGSGASGSGHEYDVALQVVRILVCTFGVIGNALVIFVILVLREYKKAVTHWYVLQLAIADSIFLLTLPFKVSEDVQGEWTFSGGMCKGKEALLFLNYYSSILFLMVMSVDRYIAVCCSFSTGLQKLRTKRAAYVITVMIWIVSLLLCIPIIMYSDRRGVDPTCKCSYEFPKHDEQTPEEYCKNQGFPTGKELEECLIMREESESQELCVVPDWSALFNIPDIDGELPGEFPFPGDAFGGSGIVVPGYEETVPPTSTNDNKTTYEMGCSYMNLSRGWYAYLFFNFFLMFVFPLLIMSVCYCRIAIRLRKTHTRRSSITNEGTRTSSGKGDRKRTESAATTKAEKNRVRVTCICLILVVLFMVCWLPFHAVHLAKMTGITGTPVFCASISSWTSLISYVNSALNPYIYNFIGTKFGRRLLSAGKSVKTSVKQRTASLSSAGGTVRYKPRKQSNVGTTTNSATAVTKIYKGKSEVEFSQMPPSSDDAAQTQSLMNSSK